MQIYEFVRDSLMWIASVALLWPVNAPMMGLAVKILFGQRPIEMEDYEFWVRSTLAALVLALVTAATLVVDYVLAVTVELPPGVVHMVVLLAYLGTASYVIYLFFNLEDFFQAFGAFLIYVFLPITVLFVINAVFHIWRPMLGLTGGWLKAVQ